MEFKDMPFTEMTIDEVNEKYGTDFTEEMSHTEIGDLLDGELWDILGYFYISFCPDDVIGAMEDEPETAKALKLDLVCIMPQGIYVALY